MKQIIILLLLVITSCNKEEILFPYSYQPATTKWLESYGNHRAVLSVDSNSDVASLDFDWRRPDVDVDKRCFLLVNAVTGDTVPNILRGDVTRENCQLKFGPVEKGKYYFYYLPYKVQKGQGGYGGDYLPKEKNPTDSWLKIAKSAQTEVSAKILTVESRTLFDSFYPMEITATKKEVASYQSLHKGKYWIFVEDRKYPIRMKKDIPYKWIKETDTEVLKASVSPNEYYAFQVGVLSGNQEIKDIRYKISDLKNGDKVISSKSVTCFNIEGVDPNGNSFTKQINLEPNTVQPLWFGVDIDKNQSEGTYTGLMEIVDASGEVKNITISLTVDGPVLEDRGDDEPWRHSRLRWLNSTLGISNKPTVGYEKMQLNNNLVSSLGKQVRFDLKSGLPQSIDSWGNEILASPIEFIIQTKHGVKKIKGDAELLTQNEGEIIGKWTGEDVDLSLTCTAKMEFDGWINYIYTLVPKHDFEVEDIRLVIPMKKNHSSYFMGIGLSGQDTPSHYASKWDTAESKTNNFGVSIAVSKKTEWLWPFDSFWIGSVKAGIHCELRGGSYSGPLLNLFRPAYPASWHNEGKGGFDVKKSSTKTTTTVYSGKRQLKKGEPINFDFAFIITPVKQINYKSQFLDRYYHNGGKPIPTDEDVKSGVKIINVHHANFLNPFINYPFMTAPAIKKFTSEWHDKDCKVKMYYTIRELSNVAPEIWALRSLGDEILRDGQGGGFPWCREHFVTGYIPQWYQHFDKDDFGVTADASILTATGASRWYNYYVEGLSWLVKNTDIDGIYLDDVSFGRDVLKRMRRAMDGVKPGCIIDLHSNTGFSKGPANQYMEFFPYVDKLWFGESFMYSNMSPSNWLVDVSGIPFGLMGDMLHRGGNRWLGMQYGMTVRHPWLTDGVICDPRPIWKVWDDFGIEDSKMVGFWESNPAITATDNEIKVSTYIKNGTTLLSIGNYSTKDKIAMLSINWEQLGLDPNKITIECPSIKDFQESRDIFIENGIPIESKKGLIIVLKQL